MEMNRVQNIPIRGTNRDATIRLFKGWYSEFKRKHACGEQMRSAHEIKDEVWMDLATRDCSDEENPDYKRMLAIEERRDTPSCSLDMKEEVACELFGINEKMLQARRAPLIEAQKRSADEFERTRPEIEKRYSDAGLEARQIAVKMQVREQRLALAAAGRSLDPGTDTTQVGTDFRHDVYRELRLAGKIQPILPTLEIAPGYKSYTAPNLNDCRMLTTAANTSDAYTVNTTQNPTLGATTWTPVKLFGGTFWNTEFEDDSLYPVSAALTGCLKRGMAVALDLAFLNGDTTNTAAANINALYGSAVLGTKDPRVLFNGFRGIYYRGTQGGKSAATFTGGMSGGGTAMTVADVYTMQQELGKYGDPSQASNLFMICSDQSYWNVRNSALSLYQTDILNKDIFGLNWLTMANSTATAASSSEVPTDSLSVMEGCPINLNASGVYDNSTKTMSTAVLFNRDNFLLVVKRNFMVKIVDLDLGDQKAIVASVRYDFKEIIPNLPAVTVGYNLK